MFVNVQSGSLAKQFKQRSVASLQHLRTSLRQWEHRKHGGVISHEKRTLPYLKHLLQMRIHIGVTDGD